MIFKSDLQGDIKRLEEWVENISWVQDQILKLMGYEVVTKAVVPVDRSKHRYLDVVKIEEEKSIEK